MLDRLVQSPIIPIGFIIFVVVLLLVFLVNREQTHVQRLRGPTRFQPDWGRTRRGGSRRRRRRRMPSGEFRPDWKGSGLDRTPQPEEPDESTSNPPDSPAPEGSSGPEQAGKE